MKDHITFLSIIVPIYKVEAYLSRCIDSILSQTFIDFELLLIDDGSPDNSGQICDEYAMKDCRIKVFHKKNGGVSSARNLGLDNAKGKWIMFIDSDDTIANDALPTILKDISSYDYDLFVYSYDIIKNNTVINNKDLISTTKLNTPKQYISDILCYRIATGPVARLYKKKIAQQCRFNPLLKIGEDLLFNVEYAEKCHNGIFISPIVVYNYCQHPASAMQNNNFRKEYDILTNTVYEYLKSKEKEKMYKTELAYFIISNIMQVIFKSHLFPSQQNGYKQALLINFYTCESMLPNLYKRIIGILRYSSRLCNLYLSYIFLKNRIKKRISSL